MEEEDFSKLSPEEACTHKVWKARISGYEGCLKLFEQIEDEKSPEWNKFVPLMKKFVVDSHASCQEKGLEAVLNFVENCGTAGRTTGDVVSGIIQKCLGGPRARSKELGSHVILMYIEIEKHEIVNDELLKGTESKNPKVTAACVHVFTQALREFGPKVISSNKVIKRIPALLEDRDKVVRQETRTLSAELIHWFGPPIRQQLTAVLKPPQLSEIDNELDKIKGTPPRATRFLRSQQAKKAALATGFGCETGEDKTDEGCVVEEADPFDLLEPVDILSQLNKDFFPKLESKKWVERKEVLEELEKLLLSAPKLENGDYGDLLRTLKKIVQKDSNIVVVGFAIKCITGIASGLKKKFHQYAGFLMPCLFEKFKEKKQNVVLALRDAVDAVYLTTNLEALLEDILGCLDNKNPNIKAEMCAFLTRCFSKSTPSILTKKLLKPLCKALTCALRDQDQTVRDTSALALGTAMKAVSEKVIGPFLVDIDAQIMKKIKENYEKAEVVVKQPSTQKASKAQKKPVPEESAVSEVKPNMKIDSKPVSPLSEQPDTSNQIKLLNREEALNVAQNIVDEDIYNGMLSDDCEMQNVACNRLKEIIGTIPVNPEAGQGLLSLFTLQTFTTADEMLIPKIEVLSTIADTFPLPSQGMEHILFDISNHLITPKFESKVTKLLSSFAKSTSLNYVTGAILPADELLQPGVSNLYAEKINWISASISNTKLSFDSSFLIDLGRKASVNVNPFVRSAGVSLVGIVHLQEDTTQKENKPKPKTSAPKLKAPKVQKALTVPEKDIPSSESEPSVPDVCKDTEITKVDITSKLTESLISELGDKNWKVRAEAILKVQSIINSAPSITGNLSETAPLIAARVHDSNAKICASAIALVESIAPKMGSSCKRYIAIFLPALMKALGDQKVWIRSAVVPCLNTWGDVCGYEKFFEGEVIADALKTGTASARSELWAWLAIKLPNIPPKSFPKEELSACLSVLYNNFEDRNGDIRRNACDAALGIMLHLGYNNMVQAVDTIKGSGNSARGIKEILDKTRGNLPMPVLAKSKSVVLGNEKTSNRSVKSVQSLTILPKASKGKASLPGSKSVSSLSAKKEEVESPLLPVNNLKLQRIIDEQKLKILKWSFIAPRPEFVDLLRDLMCAASLNKVLIAHMFHIDFKYHLRAIDSLSEDLPTNKEGMKSNLDLILRWMTLRFFDTNPSVLLRGLEYLNVVFITLTDDEYSMLDNEAAGFLPYLILKFGDQKDTVRNSVRALLRQIASVYPSSKQFAFLMDGVKSKNARQRSECLEQVCWLIEECGVSVCHPNTAGAIKEIAKHIADRDSTVRNAAMNCVVTAYFLVGEKVLKMVGKITDKDMDLLEQRIKTAAKNRPLVPVQPDINNLEHVHISDPIVVLTPTSNTCSEEVLQGNVDDDIQMEDTASTISKPELPVNVYPTITSSIPRPRMTPTGAFSIDRTVVAGIDEGFAVHFQAPKLLDIDLQFLKDSGQTQFQPIQMPTMTPTISSYSRPSAIKRELVNIASSDIERAMSAVSRIELIISSEKSDQLIEYTDHLTLQLVHLIIILNQSAHPEVVNCYNATFSLLVKICDGKQFCSQISQETLYNLIEQFLVLLTEDSDQHMFTRVVNNLIIRFLETSNRTNAMCALLRLIYACVSNPKATKHFKELVVKCLWKLNRSQSEWDSELDYTRLLYEIETFFKDYPTSWWKNEEFDLPLRTVKTVLHTMVKIRGVKVREIIDGMPNISKDSELHAYIKKLIKHLKVDNVAKDSQPRDSAPSQEKESNISTSRLTKEEQDELSGIFRMIGDCDETAQGMKRLFTFMKTHPETNVEPFLSKTNPQFQQYIKRGLQALEERQIDVQEINKKDISANTDGSLMKSKEPFTEEAEVLWNKLKNIQEKSGCESDKKKEDSAARADEENKREKTTAENETESSELESLRKRIANMKLGPKPTL